MINETMITHTLLSKMMLKKAHGNVGRNMTYHWLHYNNVIDYTEKFNKALKIVKDTDLCNT